MNHALHATLKRAGYRTIFGAPLPYGYERTRERFVSLAVTALIMLAAAGTTGWTQLAGF